MRLHSPMQARPSGAYLFFFFSSRRRHTRFDCDWSSDVCSSDLPIPVRGADPTERLVRFLGDVLYLYDTERFVPDRGSPARLSGEPFDPARHHALREVKAATYHGAAVLRDAAGCPATIVFDV